MMFENPLFNYSIIFLVVVGLVYFHKKLVYPYFKLPFGVSFSLFILILVSIYAAYFTTFKTSMSVLLAASLFVLIINFQKKHSQEGIKRPEVFFLLSYLFHLIVVLVVYLIIHLVYTKYVVTMQYDSFFYITKILFIKQHGIETVMDIDKNPFTFPYHYIDLWSFALAKELPIPIYVLIPILICPFFSALISQVILETSSKAFSVKTFLLSNFAIYIFIFFFPFMRYFVDILPLQYSIFSVNKYIFTALALALSLFFVIRRNYNEAIVVSAGLSITNTVIMSSLVFMVATILLGLLIKKRLKEILPALIFSIIVVTFSLFLYKDYVNFELNSTNNNTKLNYLEVLKFFTLSLIYPIYFAPYVVVSLLSNSWKSWSIRLKKLLELPYLAIATTIIGASLASAFTQNTVVDFRQFYHVTLICIAGVLIPIFWLKTMDKFTLTSKILLTFLIGYMGFYNYFYFNISHGRYEWTKRDIFFSFIENYGFPEVVCFLTKKDWHKDFHSVWPEASAPYYLVLTKGEFPVKMYWIDTYNNEIPKNYKFYQSAIRVVTNTPFQNFFKKSKFSLEEAQIAFMNKKKCKYLITTGKKASSALTKLFHDSLRIDENRIIYVRKIN